MSWQLAKKSRRNKPIFKTARTSYKPEDVNSIGYKNRDVDTHLRREKVLLSLGD